MIQRVETLAQIHVHHMAQAVSAHERRRFRYGIMGAAVFPVSIARRMKMRIENRHQNVVQRLLNNPVSNCRNAKEADAAVRLAYLLAANRLRALRLILQLPQ